MQESLTNVVRHAGGAATRVALHYAPDAVAVTIEDDGPELAVDHTPGHGVAEMTERASFVGGTLTTGRRAPDGFAVRAVLPAPGVDQ